MNMITAESSKYWMVATLYDFHCLLENVVNIVWEAANDLVGGHYIGSASVQLAAR